MNMLCKSAALWLLGTGLAAAAIDTPAVVAGYQTQGYTRIEVKTGLEQVKIEAIRGTEKLEIVYDADTGAVLKTEVGTVRVGEDTTPGVEIRDRRRADREKDDDSVSGSGDDDGPEHDADDDHGKDGRGHDSRDDHGGNSGRGGSNSGKGSDD